MYMHIVCIYIYRYDPQKLQKLQIQFSLCALRDHSVEAARIDLSIAMAIAELTRIIPDP